MGRHDCDHWMRWLALVAMVTVACGDGENEPAPIESCPTVAPFTDLAALNRTVDNDLAGIADRVAGFGGYKWVPDDPRSNESALLSIYLVTDTDELAAAAQAELGALFTGQGLSTAPREVRPARYDYRQLKTWYDRAQNIWSIPGVLFTDIQESDNRMEFGGIDTAAVECIQSNLENLGIPSDAYRVFVSQPVRPD